MISQSTKRFFLGLSIMVGTIVGAGIFGIPYAVSKSGIIPGLFYFLVLGVLITFVHLFSGEFILRTEGNCRLPGLAQRYLGEKAKMVAIFAVILGVSGALLAYIILAGNFLDIIFSSLPSSLGGLSPFQLAFAFWLVLSFFIFRGIKVIAPAEIFTNVLFFALILFIIWFFLPKLDFSNLVLFNSADLFLPYGVALFSLVGWSAIPEMIDIFKTSEEKKKIKKVIIVSTIVVVTLYILFSMAVLGITGGNPSSDTLSGLAPFLDSRIIMLLTLAGVITLADSFLVLGLYFRNTFVHDFKMSKTLASLIACGLPMILFLIGFRSFIGVIGFVGTVLGAVEGVLLLLIFRKAKVLGQRTPEYSLKVPSALVYFIILMFVLGAIFEFVL